MSNEITSKEENVPEEKSGLFISNAELINVGCKNCIWKLHGQCPHNFKGDESYSKAVKEFNKNLDKETHIKEGNMKLQEGICDEMINFLLTLSRGEDSISGMWEQYHLYKASIQESEESRDLITLTKRLKILEKELLEEYKSLVSNEIPEEKAEELLKLRHDKSSAKIWWTRMNEHLVKSHQKVRDREVKESGSAKQPGIFHADTINFNIGKKQIEEKKG